ncbi:N-acetylmuramoyl-L-alanine amidase [Celeribacter arenosi]|uniref:N-acetylmuramoyl-L-alanine amidase n=1 Tax=Celeribacter arenosi TaxID=792649 RepID=A0ABP7JUE0_9RHOB
MSDLTIRDIPSPNCGERRGGVVPDMVVIHYTAMESAAAACARLCSQEHEVSAHYLVDITGEIIRLVPEDLRAWHAGAGAWGDVTDVNSRSIGIELANRGAEPFAAAQMDALELLLADLLTRHRIAPERVIGHQDMAPARKSDPGPRFDWRRLSLSGLAVWPEAGEADPSGFFDDLTAFGYPQADDPARLAAFRARFRPRREGSVDRIDAGLAHDLAARFPVDPTPANA